MIYLCLIHRLVLTAVLEIRGIVILHVTLKALLCVVVMVIILQSCSHHVLLTNLHVLTFRLLWISPHELLVLRCIFDLAVNSVLNYLLTRFATSCMNKLLTTAMIVLADARRLCCTCPRRAGSAYRALPFLDRMG